MSLVDQCKLIKNLYEKKYCSFQEIQAAPIGNLNAPTDLNLIANAHNNISTNSSPHSKLIYAYNYKYRRSHSSNQPRNKMVNERNENTRDDVSNEIAFGNDIINTNIFTNKTKSNKKSIEPNDFQKRLNSLTKIKMQRQQNQLPIQIQISQFHQKMKLDSPSKYPQLQLNISYCNQPHEIKPLSYRQYTYKKERRSRQMKDWEKRKSKSVACYRHELTHNAKEFGNDANEGVRKQYSHSNYHSANIVPNKNSNIVVHSKQSHYITLLTQHKNRVKTQKNLMASFSRNEGSGDRTGTQWKNQQYRQKYGSSMGNYQTISNSNLNNNIHTSFQNTEPGIKNNSNKRVINLSQSRKSKRTVTISILKNMNTTLTQNNEINANPNANSNSNSPNTNKKAIKNKNNGSFLQSSNQSTNININIMNGQMDRRGQPDLLPWNIDVEEKDI